MQAGGGHEAEHNAWDSPVAWQDRCMGSSGWSYTVEYQADVNAALQQLRQQVYERGDYHRESRDPDLDMTDEEFRASLAPRDADPERYDAIVEDWLERRSRPEPIDPDTLVAAQPHSGTHSIMDMVNGVSAEPAFATVSPLAADNLMYTFGTVTPTTSQVQAWMSNDTFGERDAWVGTYVVSYHDGRPDHIHFCSRSGD
ncbi:hypothetical protein KZZ52_28925 [Dactylosporangium sp. AC04546]|uniref:hypothetical protein n=1 Tax=Dactylosporangium sp. AC04546 TaxID=2862460 RepID=UPI002E7B86AC|nr:hypothetical protein [Dactylosporangium sp. AC04546]WVK89292.1 hypothetical protein KZZ52_28925 [Dactylosporangium sp. AC04546]